MVDDNLIKPVEINQNVMSVNSAKGNEEKKKHQNFNERHHRNDEPIKDEIIEANGEKISVEINENGKDKHSIDFCA